MLFIKTIDILIFHYLPQASGFGVLDHNFSHCSLLAGTTWMQELLYQIHTGAVLDSEESKQSITLRVPQMEITQKHVTGQPSGTEMLESYTSPRLMKSHCPAWFFDEQLRARKGKFVVVMRNIKDSLVSYFHFYKAATMCQFETGTWGEFFELFKAKKLMHGDWLKINLSWWKQRENTNNVLILKYEEMKKRPEAELLKLTRFLGKALSADQVERILRHTSFDIMKDNTAINDRLRTEFYNSEISPFCRKGIVGSWQEHFTPEQNAYVEGYIEEAEKHGLTFEYN